MSGEFLVSVKEHTAEARRRWAFMEEKPTPKSLWNQVLTEEMGKLSRCCNKLTLAQDPDAREHWSKEGKFRLVTIASIVSRFYDAFETLPDAPEVYSCLANKP